MLTELQDALDWIVRATDIELVDPENEEKLNIVIKAARKYANPDGKFEADANVVVEWSEDLGFKTIGYISTGLADGEYLVIRITEDTK